MRKLLLAAAAFALLPLAPAGAAVPVAQKMTCPIGGKEFSFSRSASYSTYGARPDGKPYGSSAFPLALPECPDSGLVLYKEYDAAEVAKLEPLVASDAYQVLRSGDSQYYRAYWLMREMGLAPEAYLWALLQASWEADTKPELKTRYQTELAAVSAAVPAKPGDLTWLGMEARAINALREVGRFDEAMARFEKLPATALKAPAIPAAAPKSGTDKAGDTARVRKGWADFLNGLRAVIARKDASSEPLDLLPRNIALSRCIDKAAELTDYGRTYCAEQSAMVEELRAARAKREAELKALGESRDKSGR